jgi:hypothetical protein
LPSYFIEFRSTFIGKAIRQVFHNQFLTVWQNVKV